LDNQLSRAKKEADTEFQENIREQERRKGNRVVYGDVIQLQHVASGKYITIRSEASITESNNLLVREVLVYTMKICVAY
jgi:inositol 1,4,5-triphosphate receptor type 1